MIIDYSNYTSSELEEGLENINKDKFPDNYEALLNEISKRRGIDVSTLKIQLNSLLSTSNSHAKNIEHEMLASRESRFIGALVDVSLASILSIPIIIYLGIWDNIDSYIPPSIQQLILSYIWGSLLFLILNGYLLYKKGQTIGKIVVKTKIVTINGDLPNFARLIFLRYFGFGMVTYIPFVGGFISLINVFFIFRSDRRCLHDILANTKVINA